MTRRRLIVTDVAVVPFPIEETAPLPIERSGFDGLTTDEIIDRLGEEVEAMAAAIAARMARRRPPL